MWTSTAPTAAPWPTRSCSASATLGRRSCRPSRCPPRLTLLRNYNKFTFKLGTTPQGLFTGTFTIPNTNKALIRNGKFAGIMVWTGSTYIASGYFLLSQSPQSGETVATSPILSGQIMLEPHPGKDRCTARCSVTAAWKTRQRSHRGWHCRYLFNACALNVDGS